VLLERGFGSLWLEAEISNFSRPAPDTGISRSRTPPPRCAAPCSGSETCCAPSPRATAKRCWYGPASACTSRAASTSSSSITWRMPGSAPAAPVRGARARLAGRGPVRRRAQAPAAGAAAAHRRHHLAHRRRGPRHPARAGAALSGAGGADLSRCRAGRAAAAEIVAALELAGAAPNATC
jgi:hypothetical protein